MAISEERLREFADLWEKAFGERLSVDEARPIAERLVVLARMLTRPLPKRGRQMLELLVEKHAEPRSIGFHATRPDDDLDPRTEGGAA